MRKILLIAVILFASLFFVLSISSAEITKEMLQKLIEINGKKPFILRILQHRSKHITVFVNGKYIDFAGFPSEEFINADTILIDLNKLGIDTFDKLKRFCESKVIYSGGTYNIEKSGGPSLSFQFGSSSNFDKKYSARLYVPGLDSVLVAVTEKAFDQLVKASIHKDNYGIASLVLIGLVLEVPNGTPVKIIDRGFLKTRVRILDGTHAGRSGWVPMEWVEE